MSEAEPPTDLDLPDNLPPTLRSVVEASATPGGRKVMWWVIGGLLGLAFLAFLAVGANRPADPVLGAEPTTTTTVPRVKFGTFGELALRVLAPGTAPDPAATPFCVLMADTPAQRAQGLMGRQDLGGYDGMLFVFPQETTASFHMRNTPLPLTIAFFDTGGTFVSSADMAPCGNSARCPRYSAAGRYRMALEVPQGGLARLKVGPGSRLVLGGACT
ncbi:MAG TPA: DUF192 domain-containing protein [Acidimicrobiales bacterium]|nr:DUF192 domain-containing protein [Acidimicrobiales bacterium]